MRTLPLLVVVGLIACGPPPAKRETQPVGGGCVDSLDCDSGLACEDTMLHGYCTRSCGGDAACRGDGMCIRVGNSGMCAAECSLPGGQSTCRDGYTCYSVKDSSKGVCFPDGFDFGPPPPPAVSPPPKASIGAACSSSAECGSESCYDPAHGWPGGYCSKACSASNSCGANAVCLTDTNSCVALCPSPGAQSTCRDGYVCRGFSNRTDGFCTPAPKSRTGAACGNGSTCSDGACFANWPNGYCTRGCNFGSDCNSGVCLNDEAAGQKYCVATCAAPGAQSTCRAGYVCSAFAGRSDGFCEPASANNNQGTGGGGGGGAGGGGGGTSMPSTLNYRLHLVSGLWKGSAVNVVSAVRTDTLAMNQCNWVTSSPNMGGVLSAVGATPNFSVPGSVNCPAGSATSTAAASCTSQIINTNATMELKVEVSGWSDDAQVTFKMRYPPVGLPGCNYANVIMDAANLWGIEGTVTVGDFRRAFEQNQNVLVTMVGQRALASGTKTSDVSWSFMLVLEPN